MRLEHPIFREPLDPHMTFQESPTPQGYRNWYEGADLPGKIRTWTVQEGKLGREVDYGLVSDPYGFEDSPDAELISSGINSKSPLSVALGRHGNYFLWGFAGDPKQMTGSARRVFLNAIAYMKAFDGRRPLVERKGRSRDWAHAYLPSKKAGNDRDDIEFLFPSSGGFAVDADLKELGAPNRKPSFFDAIEKRLAADPEDALSLRLLDRYVGLEEVRTPAGLRAWLAKNREFLFFSDVGGFRWLVDEHARRARSGAAPSAR